MLAQHTLLFSPCLGIPRLIPPATEGLYIKWRGHWDEGVSMAGSADTVLNTEENGDGSDQCACLLEITFPWRHSRLTEQLEVGILPPGN